MTIQLNECMAFRERTTQGNNTFCLHLETVNSGKKHYTTAHTYTQLISRSPSPFFKTITCESSGPRKQDRMKERDLTLNLGIVDKKPPSLRTVDYSTSRPVTGSLSRPISSEFLCLCGEEIRGVSTQEAYRQTKHFKCHAGD